MDKAIGIMEQRIREAQREINGLTYDIPILEEQLNNKKHWLESLQDEQAQLRSVISQLTTTSVRE